MKNSFKTLAQSFEFIAFFMMILILRLIGIRASKKICKNFFSKLGPHTKSGWVVRNNLSYIFPKISLSKQKLLEKKIWQNFGSYVGEFPFIKKKYLSENKLVSIKGSEILKKLNNENKNYIVFSAHIANWEVAINDIAPLIGESGVIYRKINNKFIDKYVKSLRSCNGVNLIAKGPYGAMDLIKLIKKRKNLMMLIDQKMNEGIKVPFLGKLANTPEAPAVIAREYGYGLVPVRIERQNEKFILTIQEPIFINKSENKEKDIYDTTLKINNIISDWVIAKPEEWFWMHQRWGKPHEMTDR